MLENLEIRNYALIDNINIDFKKGFNVITGETGAGKSIILKALGLLMGEKADSQSIRKGAETMTINAVFSLPKKHPVEKWLEDRGLFPEENLVYVRRIVKANGSRGSFFIQNQISSRKDVMDFSSLLIDLHGQSEHQSLLKQENQRIILDSWCEVSNLLKDISDEWKSKQEILSSIAELLRQKKEAERKRDYLEFTIEEIEKVKPKKNEDEEIQEELDVLEKFEEIYENLSTANLGLKECKGLMFDAVNNCKKASRADKKLESITTRLEEARIETEDIYEFIRDEVSSMTFSQERLDSLQDRFSLLQRLKKKYGPSLDQVIEYWEETKNSLNSINSFDDKFDDLNNILSEKNKKIDSLCRNLSDKRKKGAIDLQQKIEEKLKHLGMERAVFTIDVINSEPSINGADDIDFLLSANPGEEKGLISKIASGGELSRVMLALKTVLAEVDNMDTQVFDEVDTGIGGSVALEVGDQLVSLSEKTQVIAITHLASIAAKADNHLVVEKTFKNGRTYTELKKVDGKTRKEEIARMLSGEVTKESLQHAENLINK